jgi:hypothetical protein
VADGDVNLLLPRQIKDGSPRRNWGSSSLARRRAVEVFRAFTAGECGFSSDFNDGPGNWRNASLFVDYFQAAQELRRLPILLGWRTMAERRTPVAALMGPKSAAKQNIGG